MAGRESAAVERAVARALAGETVSGAALAEQVARQSLMRALRRRGVPARGAVAGAGHHAFKDGAETAAQRQARAQAAETRRAHRDAAVERAVARVQAGEALLDACTAEGAPAVRVRARLRSA